MQKSQNLVRSRSPGRTKTIIRQCKRNTFLSFSKSLPKIENAPWNEICNEVPKTMVSQHVQSLISNFSFEEGINVASRPGNPEVWVKKQLTDIPAIRLLFRTSFLSGFPISRISVCPNLLIFRISKFPIYQTSEFPIFRISGLSDFHFSHFSIFRTSDIPSFRSHKY